MLPRRYLEAIGAVGERIYGRFSSVDQSGRFVLVPNLGKPLYREKTVYIKTHTTAINRPVDHTGEM